MIDPTPIAALKDFAAIPAAIVGGLVTYFLVARPQRKSEAKRMEFEQARGTGRDPTVRADVYVDYLQCLDAFYEPGDQSAYRAWLSSYSAVTTKMQVLGLDDVGKVVAEVTALLDSIRTEHLTGVSAADFEEAWYTAAESHQSQLDQARQRVVDAVHADVGAAAVSQKESGVPS